MDRRFVSIYSKELTFEKQLEELKSFQQRLSITLIATHALSPVFDFGTLEIKMIVNFDIPLNQSNEIDCETYQYRIGLIENSGEHSSNKLFNTYIHGKNLHSFLKLGGFVINYFDSEQSVEACEKLEKHFGQEIHILETEDLSEYEMINGNASDNAITALIFQKMFHRQDPNTPLWSMKSFEELGV